MIHNILSLEGVPFAGKTTIILELLKRFPNTFIYIPEVSEYIGGHQNNPKLPFTSFNEAKANAHFVLAVEKRRCADIKKVQKRTTKHILVDRTTSIFSLMFFRFIEDKRPFDYGFKDSFYLYAKALFQSALEKDEIFIPSKIAYLRPGNESVFKKRLPRGATTGIFTSWQNVLYFDHIYKEILQDKYPISSITLNSFNTRRNIENLSVKILTLMNERKSAIVSDNFFTLFTDQDHTGINLDLLTEERLFRDVHSHYNLLMDRAGISQKLNFVPID